MDRRLLKSWYCYRKAGVCSRKALPETTDLRMRTDGGHRLVQFGMVEDFEKLKEAGKTASRPSNVTQLSRERG